MSWLDLLFETLRKLSDLALSLGPYTPTMLLAAVWCAVWLWAVNWNKFWPVLAQGAWVPFLLLAIIAAVVWAQLQPCHCEIPGFLTLANGWWQCSFVGMLLAVALFCGWLQGYFGWMPQEIDLEPPAIEHGHGHGHH
jgi:hypothetical protein